MPNCVFPQCSVQRIPKYNGISLFEITRRKGDFFVQWRNNLIAAIARYRVIDKTLQDRLDRGQILICERHFRPEEIERTKTGKKTLRLQAVPSLNLPNGESTEELDMVYCQAYGCSNRPGKTLETKSYYNFPDPEKEKKRTERWLYNIGTGLTIETFEFNNNKRVCSDHFHPDCFRDMTAKLPKYPQKTKLKVGAIPTIFKHKTYKVINMSGAVRHDICPTGTRKRRAEKESDKSCDDLYLLCSSRSWMEEEKVMCLCPSLVTSYSSLSKQRNDIIKVEVEEGVSMDNEGELATRPEVSKCEYCGLVGIRNNFYSKSKRFCKKDCSKEYSVLVSLLKKRRRAQAEVVGDRTQRKMHKPRKVVKKVKIEEQEPPDKGISSTPETSLEQVSINGS